MTTYPIVKVNGINMVDPDRRWGLGPSQQLFRSLPGRRATSIVVPGMSGVLWPADDPYDVPSFPMVVRVFSPNTSNKEADYAELVERLESIYYLFSQTPVRLEVQVSATKTYEAMARVVATSDPTFTNRDMAELSVIFELPDVFWRSTTYAEVSLGTVGTVPGADDFLLTPFTGSTAPIKDAEFLVRGPFSEFRLSQMVNGIHQGFRIRRNVGNGRWVHVKCGDMTAIVYDNAVWDGTGGNPNEITTDVDSYGSGRFPGWCTLLPLVATSGGATFSEPADRKVYVGAVAAGSGSYAPTSLTQFRARGRKAYL